MHVLGYFFDPTMARWPSSCASARRSPSAGRGDGRAPGGPRHADRSRRALLASVTRRQRPRPGATARRRCAGRGRARPRSWRRLRPVPRRGPAGIRAAQRRRRQRGAGIVAAAGGVASLAHPGLMPLDPAIPGFVARGLPAIEVCTATTTRRDRRYRQLAQTMVIVSGRVGFPCRPIGIMPPASAASRCPSRTSRISPRAWAASRR